MYDWNGLSGGILPGRNAEGNEACGLVQAVIRPHDEAFTNGTLRYPSLRALGQGGFCSLGSFSLSLPNGNVSGENPFDGNENAAAAAGTAAAAAMIC